MSKEIKRTIKITTAMAEYIRLLAEKMQISENDVIKMFIHEDMRKYS